MRALFRVLPAVVLALLPGLAAALPLDSLLTHAMEGRFVPGMSVLVIRDGQIAERAVRGRRSSDAPDSVTLDDVWHLGSCGKPMTATLVAKLVERKVLAWDTPLPKLLPEVAKTMRPEYRTVTLVQLMSHTSGLPENVPFDSLLAMYDDRRPLPVQRLAYARLALQDPPIAPPGTKTSYSNSAFMIVAAAIEHATHKSFEDLMRHEVFEPLGMTTAGFGPTHRGQPLGHEKGAPIEGPKADNPLAWAPVGGIYMSMQDWARFSLDHMLGEQGGGKLLRRETYAYLHTPVMGHNALDWGIAQEKYGVAGRLMQHTGSNGDWFAIIGIVPESRSGVLVACNVAEDGEGDKACAEVFKALVVTLPQKP